MGTGRPIRIGVVGCGRILPAHLRGLKRLKEAGLADFRIMALTSGHRESAEMFRRRGEGPPPRPPVTDNPADPLSAPHLYVSDLQDDIEAVIYDTWEELLDRAEVDALDIPATVALHHIVAVRALERGIHCMVEKPIAVSVRAARRMVEAAQQGRAVLAVMETVRYGAQSRLARFALERGALGQVQIVANVHIGTGAWSPDKIVAETAWRHRVLEAGGGATADIGVHQAHGLRYLYGEVERIWGLTRVFEPLRYRRDAQGRVREQVQADADDAYFALLELASGAVAQLSFTWAGHGEPTGLAGGAVAYGSRGNLKGGTLFLDGQAPLTLREYFEQYAAPADRERLFPLGLERQDPFAHAFLDFFRAIGGGPPPETSGEEGLRDLALALGIAESSALGRPVTFQEVLSGQARAYQQRINAHYGLA